MLIKNCIFKTKLLEFLEQTQKRLLERGFDKIKENNWVVEDRKEILEAIIKTRLQKTAMIRWHKSNRKL